MTKQGNAGIKRPLPEELTAMLNPKRWVKFHPVLARLCGDDIPSGIFLSQALYWAQRTHDPDGWFYKSAKDWTQETGLTRSQCERVRFVLKCKGFLKEKLTGRAPATVHYLVSLPAIQRALSDLLGMSRSLQERKQLDSSKVANKTNENQQTSLQETAKLDSEEVAIQIRENLPTSLEEDGNPNNEERDYTESKRRASTTPSSAVTTAERLDPLPRSEPKASLLACLQEDHHELGAEQNETVQDMALTICKMLRLDPCSALTTAIACCLENRKIGLTVHQAGVSLMQAAGEHARRPVCERRELELGDWVTFFRALATVQTEGQIEHPARHHLAKLRGTTQDSASKHLALSAVTRGELNRIVSKQGR